MRCLLLGVKNLANKFKDHSGRYPALDLCNKLLNNPKGAWGVTYTTYIRSVTGVKDPLHELNFGVKVPGRPWHVVGHLPYQAKNLEEALEAAEDLNALVEKWSILDH